MIRDHLEAIYSDHGYLTPQLVVDEARDKSHPLHTHFEWDNKLAGEAWRREQASEMIRTVRVVQSSGKKLVSTRAYHSVPANGGKPVYVEVHDLDPVQRQLLVQQMHRDWQTFKSRYEGLTEFIQLMDDEAVAQAL